MADGRGSYSYTRIKKLTVGQIHNVYGVIKSFKGPHVSKEGWKILSMRLVDESCVDKLHDFLPCVLFGSNRFKLPDINVGDIVRFHRLKVSRYQGHAQGKESPGFSWLVLSENGMTHSHEHLTYTKDDEKRIKKLQDWKEKSSFLKHHLSATRIADIQHKDDWINMAVQVVAAYQSDNDSSCTILVAWDGTVPSFMSHCYCSMDRRTCEMDKKLERMSSGRTVKIFCYDNHSDVASKLVSGQLIKLVNVHAKVIEMAAVRTAFRMGVFNKEQPPDTSLWLALVLHQGNSNGRRIIVLQETEEEHKKLSELLSEIEDNVESQSILSPSSMMETDDTNNDARENNFRDENEEELLSSYDDDILGLAKAEKFFKMHPHLENELLNDL